MSADPFAPVQAGEPLSIAAVAWNALLEREKAARQGRRSDGRKDPLGWGGVVEVLAQNDTGGDLREYQPAAVSPDSVGGGFELPTNDTLWQRRPVLTLEEPTATTDFVAVCLEAIPDGEIGRVAIAGAVLCDVDVSGGEAFAAPTVGDTTKLTGGTSGPIRILHKPAAGGSTYRCVVLLGDQITGSGGGTATQEIQFAGGSYLSQPPSTQWGRVTALQGDSYATTRGGEQRAVWVPGTPDMRDMTYARIHGVVRGSLAVDPFTVLPGGERVYVGVIVQVRAAKAYDWETGGSMTGVPTGSGAILSTGWMLSEVVEASTTLPAVLEFAVPFVSSGFSNSHNVHQGVIDNREVRVNFEVLPVVVQTSTGGFTPGNYEMEWHPQFTCDLYPPQYADVIQRGTFGPWWWHSTPGRRGPEVGPPAIEGRVKTALAPTVAGRTYVIGAVTTSSSIGGRIDTATGGVYGGAAGVVLTARLDATGATTSVTTNASGEFTFTGLAAGNYEIYKATGPDSLSPPSTRVYVPGNVYDVVMWDGATALAGTSFPGFQSMLDIYASIAGNVAGLGGTPCRVVCWKQSDIIGTPDQGPLSDAFCQAWYARDRFCCMTDSSGNYRFAGLPPGTYTVALDPSVSGAHTPSSITGIVAAAGVPVTGQDFS